MTILDNAPNSPTLTEQAVPSSKVAVGTFSMADAWQVSRARLRRVLEANRSEIWLLGPVTAYLVVILGAGFGLVGFGVAVGIAGLLARFGPRLSADTLLQLYRTQEIAPAQGTSLKAALAELSLRAGLVQTPRIAIIPSVAVAAFSAGRNNRPAIFLSEGLLQRFSLGEIIAILAHEIAHIRAGDLGFFALADTLTRFAQVLCYVGVALSVFGFGMWLIGEPLVEPWLVIALMLAPCLNSQLQLHLSRRREFDADGVAAQMLGEKSALRAVILAMEPDFGAMSDDFRLPVPQRRNPIPSPARAHLANSKRLALLADLPPTPTIPPLRVADKPLVSLVGVGPIEMRPRNRWPGLWF